MNIDMDLEPFERINPCGYAGLQVTQLADYINVQSIENIGEQLVNIMIKALSERK